jgi:hypothetical protein
MVAMSDFSTFSQMTCVSERCQRACSAVLMGDAAWIVTYRDAVGVLLPDALGLGLALLERVLVLELGAHVGGLCVGG